MAGAQGAWGRLPLPPGEVLEAQSRAQKCRHGWTWATEPIGSVVQEKTLGRPRGCRLLAGEDWEAGGAWGEGSGEPRWPMKPEVHTAPKGRCGPAVERGVQECASAQLAPPGRARTPSALLPWPLGLTANNRDVCKREKQNLIKVGFSPF